MRPFDPLETPLQGPCLIEAGAGTGKTYTITTLALRLVLQKGLVPEQILVVTFTTAATAELRDRLRRRFRDAKGRLLGRRDGDAVLEGLLASCGPRERALRRLEDALANFDRMPVFTIHGFCQRILAEMAFETGSGFDTELVTDTSRIIQDIADDFWRKTWPQMPPEVTAFAQAKLKSPENLADLYRQYSRPDIALLPEAEALPAVSCDTYRALWSQAREQWRADRQAIVNQLAAADLKANVYGRSDRPAAAAGSRSQRQAKLQAWGQMIDRWVRSAMTAFPPPEALTYFTRTKLAASLKKGGELPRHAFFETCDRIGPAFERLRTDMEQWLVVLKVHFFRTVADELHRAKQERQMLFFDDLLLMLRDALAKDRGGILQQRLRTRYRAALIDEFQDTDSIQYAIFKTLFQGREAPLFMIGDPKQAIYSFRGADIFTYLRAARHAAHRYTLTVNWRSTRDMVQAVNVLFGRSPMPFLWPAIAFHPTAAAQPHPSAVGTTKPEAALTVWYLGQPAPNAGLKGWTKQAASEAIGAALAHEIRRLASAGDEGRAQWRCQDMAVLVRTNRQARDIKRHLSQAGVPGVVYQAGSVFHSSEALHLERLLEAVADPGDDVKLRTAHGTPYLGRRGEELDFGESEPAWWEEALDRFHGYQTLWIESGFIRMFRRLLLQEQIAPRLLGTSSGERCLTNLLHLAELLHQTSLARSLGPSELIQWLRQQRRLETEAADAHQLRLESDAEAVTIMTVHKSKGLEFPVVFCPFAWEGLRTPKAPALCHAGRDGQRRLLDFGSLDLDDHLGRMAEERMAEELRLLYVAVTRAKRRCYLVWGPLPSSAQAALSYLLNPEMAPASQETAWEAIEATARTVNRQPPATHRGQVMKLVRESRGTIDMVELPPAPGEPAKDRRPRPSLVPARAFQRAPFANWKIISFSSLIQQRRPDGEIRDDPPDHRDGDREWLAVAENGPPEAALGAIAEFEAGARAGLMFHDILERIDFSAPDSGPWETIVADRLQTHGYAPSWKAVILAMLERVMNVPLSREASRSFALRQIRPQDRINEMDFHLPLGTFDAAALTRVLATRAASALRGGAPMLDQLAFVLEGGFLKGYIDLVFRHEGRFYLLDWKSNLLGDTLRAYRPERLSEVMASEGYFLQYHLYALAVDRFLAASFPDYRYGHHFGGVFYCFIRGMATTPARTTHGVFFDRPTEETMEGLRSIML